MIPEPPPMVVHSEAPAAVASAMSSEASLNGAPPDSESDSTESLHQLAARILSESKVRAASETARGIDEPRLDIDAGGDAEGPDVGDLSELRLSSEETAMRKDSTLLAALDPEPESIPVPLNGNSNSRLEMSREMKLKISRTLLGKAKHFSMSLRLEDSEDKVVGNLERRFALAEHDPDLAELLLSLNVTVSSND